MYMKKLRQLSHLMLDKCWPQVVPQASATVDAGHLLSFDYLPDAVHTMGELKHHIEIAQRAVVDASTQFPGCHWSMKPQLWGLSSGIELLQQAVEQMNALCQAHHVVLRLDTAPEPYQTRCLHLALKLPCVQPVLAVNSATFAEHLRICLAKNRIPRLVKGYSGMQNSEYTEMERITEAVQLIWGSGCAAAIATHDNDLILALMELPDYKLGMLELEMVAHLVTRPRVVDFPVQLLRLYYPFGPGIGAFFGGRLFHSPVNRHSVSNAYRRES